MNHRISTRKLLAAAALLAAPLGWPSGASADLLFEYSTDGGATFTPLCSAPSGTSCVLLGSVPLSNGLAVVRLPTTGEQAGAASNSPGMGTEAHLFSQMGIENTNTSGTATVEFLIGDTGFTMPTAPPASALKWASAIGVDVSTPGTAPFSNSASYFSCIDQLNGQNACPGTFHSPTQSLDITGEPASYISISSMTVSPLSSPYSMTEELTLTLAAGGLVGFDASTVPVSAPQLSSLPILGWVLVVGLGWFSRRRRTAPVT
jgi:hypothetical protein